jgi:hypothetical protein
MPKKSLPNSHRRHFLRFKFGMIEQFSELKGVDLKNLDQNKSVMELQLFIPVQEYLLRGLKYFEFCLKALCAKCHLYHKNKST